MKTNKDNHDFLMSSENEGYCKAKLFCPNCGKRKIYFLLDCDEYTHGCIACKTKMTLKHFDYKCYGEEDQK